MYWKRLGNISQIRGGGLQHPSEMTLKALPQIALTVYLPRIPYSIILQKFKKTFFY